MANDKETAIQKYMASLEISREEAEQLWEDDQEDFIGDEGEEMTTKAKEVMRTIHGAEDGAKKTKKNAPRERKANEEKRLLVTEIFNALSDIEGVEANITNLEKYVEFTYNGNHYTVNLVQNRKLKK